MNEMWVLSCGILDGNSNINSIDESEWTVLWFALGIQCPVSLEVFIYFILSKLVFEHD